MKKAVRLFLVLCFVLSLNGCDDWDDWFNNDDDSDSTNQTDTVTLNDDTSDDASDDTASDDEVTDSETLRYDHYNPAAWHGKGSAIVLCSNSPTMDSCDIDGTSLVQHGSLDRGRVVFTSYNKKGLSGTVTCTDGSTTYTTEVSGSGMQDGSCN